MTEVSSALRIEPDWIKFDRCILRYMCFSKEAVSGSAIENYRIRKFILRYFLEDKTVEMTEVKDDNSGMVGGTFFKRQQLKHKDGIRYICPDQDLRCGLNIEVYSKVFRIVAMDEFTRSYYDRCQIEQGTEESIPDDPFSARMRSATQRRDKISLEIIREKALVNVLCGGTDLNRKVKQFIEKGGKILRFFCVWNDDSEDGYIHHLHLHFFLADDTVEIIEKEDRGKQRLFFKRAVLSKHGLSPVIADKYDERNYNIYTANDFITGATVCIGGRNIYIYDCDQFTRDYYRNELGIELVTFKDPHKPKEENVHQPMLNIHQTPKPAQCDNSVILRFEAIIHQAARNHASRRFIVSAYPTDNSFSVFETPVRNSGFLPGKFAERDERENFPVKNFQVGSVIVASGTKFELIACDEFTQNFLKQYRH